MKKKLLIINRQQFGYHIDTYFYCKYLLKYYQITYICWDYNKPRIELEGVSVIYIPRTKIKFTRYLSFIRSVISEVNNEYDFYFIKYFIGSSLLKIRYPNKKYIFDIRTRFINYKPLKRAFLNKILYLESLFFTNITAISQSLAIGLNLNLKKVHILPLGSDIISDNNKTYDSLNLLYVGTLFGRNIEQTVEGFAKFEEEYRDKINCTYKIIGSGYYDEEDKLKKQVNNLQLESKIKVLGRIPHEQLTPYFDECNIGVSYIPMTEHFDSQPPTKTFEYILSGMPTIGTNTTENKKIIHETNGVLIDDNPNDFYCGLCELHKNKEKYNSNAIRLTCNSNTWENIVENNLRKYLEEV